MAGLYWRWVYVRHEIPVDTVLQNAARAPLSKPAFHSPTDRHRSKNLTAVCRLEVTTVDRHESSEECARQGQDAVDTRTPIPPHRKKRTIQVLLCLYWKPITCSHPPIFLHTLRPFIFFFLSSAKATRIKNHSNATERFKFFKNLYFHRVNFHSHVQGGSKVTLPYEKHTGTLLNK